MRPWEGPQLRGLSGHERPRPAEWLRDFILEASQAAGGPGHRNGSRTSFSRLCGPRAAEATQMVPRPHLGGCSACKRPRPPKQQQGFILESLRPLGGPGHPNGSRGSVYFTHLPSYSLTYFHTCLLTYSLTYSPTSHLLTYLLAYLAVYVYLLNHLLISRKLQFQ